METLKSIAIPVTRKRPGTKRAEASAELRPEAVLSTRSPGLPSKPRPSAPPQIPARQHRFRVGQRVRMDGGGRYAERAQAICVILRLLPFESGELLYRVQSDVEKYERIVGENQLTAL